MKNLNPDNRLLIVRVVGGWLYNVVAIMYQNNKKKVILTTTFVPDYITFETRFVDH